MKKALVVVAGLLAAALLVDFLLGKYLDATLKDFDIGEILVEACAGEDECLSLVNAHYPECRQDTSTMDAEQYFQAMAEVTACINDRAGVDIESMMPDIDGP